MLKDQKCHNHCNFQLEKCALSIKLKAVRWKSWSKKKKKKSGVQVPGWGGGGVHNLVRSATNTKPYKSRYSKGVFGV